MESVLTVVYSAAEANMFCVQFMTRAADKVNSLTDSLNLDVLPQSIICCIFLQKKSNHIFFQGIEMRYFGKDNCAIPVLLGRVVQSWVKITQG